jgi:hypothetical protein
MQCRKMAFSGNEEGGLETGAPEMRDGEVSGERTAKRSAASCRVSSTTFC